MLIRAELLLFFLLPQACLGASAHEMAVGTQNVQICSATTLGIVGKFMGVERFGVRQTADDPEIVRAAACKKDPAKPQITIAAVAYEAGKEDTKIFVVAFVNESKRKVVASYRGDIAEDAGMR